MKNPLNSKYQAVLALLNDESEYGFIDALIVSNLMKNTPKKTAEVILYRLENKYGFLKSNAYQKYRLTPEGKELLKSMSDA